MRHERGGGETMRERERAGAWTSSETTRDGTRSQFFIDSSKPGTWRNGAVSAFSYSPDRLRCPSWVEMGPFISPLRHSGTDRGHLDFYYSFCHMLVILICDRPPDLASPKANNQLSQERSVPTDLHLVSSRLHTHTTQSGTIPS